MMSPMVLGWLVVLASLPSGVAADTLTCDTLGGQVEARQATLEGPQVSAALFASAEGGCTDLADPPADRPALRSRRAIG